MTKSKFSLWVILTIVLIIFLTGVNYLIFSVLLQSDNGEMSFGILIFIGLLLFTWVWLTFGELRTKIITIVIDSNSVTVRYFGGLGRKISFELSEFEGCKTSLLPSKYRNYEYLYLIKNGKKKIKISQFYHSNYSKLKVELLKKVKFIGKENFNYIREFKEIFE